MSQFADEEGSSERPRISLQPRGSPNGTPSSTPKASRVYHSSFMNDEGISLACGCPLLPLRSHIRGPAPVAHAANIDIIDEALNFFRANVFFRKFEVKSTADKLLIYLTLYINMALKRVENCRTEAEGTKAIINLGLERFPTPGEPGFPLGGLFTPPQSQQEADDVKELGKKGTASSRTWELGQYLEYPIEIDIASSQQQFE